MLFTVLIKSQMYNFAERILKTGLGRKNRTSAPWSQTMSDTISLYRENWSRHYGFRVDKRWTLLLLKNVCIKLGAPRQNRTAITGLQNQCTAIVLVGLKLVEDKRIELL